MEDKININGVWYVREDIKKHIEIDPTHFEGCVVENGDFCFEAHRIVKKDGTFYDDGVGIECTDKRFANRKDWKKEYWDNNNWMRGILKHNPESWADLPDMGKSENMDLLLAFLQHLTDKGWL
jgi:hypothetical protein